MQLIFISGSLRRSSLQVALLAGSRNTFTQTFVLFPNIDSSLKVERVVLATKTYSGNKDISIEGNSPTGYKLLLVSVDITGDNIRKVTYSLHYTDEQYTVYGLTNDSSCNCTITVYGLCVKNK